MKTFVNAGNFKPFCHSEMKKHKVFWTFTKHTYSNV